ncbi:glycosyltransferase [bacterium]|nr:glycosyltransferase [bacterium]
MTPPPVSIVVPIYNEERGLPDGLPALLQLLDGLPAGSELLLVDDGSTDQTAHVLDEVVAANPGRPIRRLSHWRNLGYGRALKTGIRAATNEVIVISDADGTYPTAAIPTLLSCFVDEEAAMVVGARPVGQQPAIRRPAKAVLRWLAEYLTGARIPDLNSGLRVMRRSDCLRFENLLPNGFSFTTTITIALLSSGEKVLYHTIEYRKRIGNSKIRPFADTINFLILIMRTTLAFDPLKVYGPIGLLLLAGGLVLFVLRLILTHPIGMVTTVVLVTAGIQVLLLGLLADLVNRRGLR